MIYTKIICLLPLVFYLKTYTWICSYTILYSIKQAFAKKVKNKNNISIY